MKKRFICLVLSLCMVAGVVTGCGSSKDALSDNAITSKESEDTSSNNVVTSKESEDALSDNVSITKKLEEEYVERMEAYLAYYQEQDTDDDIRMSITLDSNHLPVMWLTTDDDASKHGKNHSVQLIGYEDGSAKILAERIGIYAVPFVTDYAVMARCITDTKYVDVGGNEVEYLIYDEDIKDFKYKTEVEFVESEGLDILNSLNGSYAMSYRIYEDSEKREVAYIGYDVCDFSDYSSLDELHNVPYTIYDYNNEVFKYLSSDEVSQYYYTFGRNYSANACSGIHHTYAEAVLRYLISHPAYTNSTLMVSIEAVETGYELIDADTLDLDSLFKSEKKV